MLTLSVFRAMELELLAPTSPRDPKSGVDESIKNCGAVFILPGPSVRMSWWIPWRFFEKCEIIHTHAHSHPIFGALSPRPAPQTGLGAPLGGSGWPLLAGRVRAHRRQPPAPSLRFCHAAMSGSQAAPLSALNSLLAVEGERHAVSMWGGKTSSACANPSSGVPRPPATACAHR